MARTVVLFQGTNASNQLGLWETDGTPGGTSELAPILGAYPGGRPPPAPPSAGLNPSNLTAFNGEVLFEGAGTNGQFTLWETDGTAVGTVELTAAALNPNSLTVFQDQVLFNGTDSSGNAELWKTNGQPGGTSEVMPPIVGAAATGLAPTDLTVFNNEVLFNGADSRPTAANPLTGLWETNGTSAGTIELEGKGVGSSTSGLDPYEITVFGADVLFGATNASGHVGLWETDGAPGGAHEIAGASSVSIPDDLTVLVNSVFPPGEVLFNGTDSTGHIGLWETDGTSVSELTGIIGANPGTGPGSGFDPRSLAAFGGEVLFNGTDASLHQGLWETDGTAGGTHEIFAGSGNPAGLDPSGFEIFKGEVLFNGKDASGNHQLWETDGKVGGMTEQLTGINNVSASGLEPLDLTAATLNPPVASSLLWQNNTSGQGSIWELSGSVLVGGGPVSPNPGPSWRAVGTADFFGGGSSDILWQNTSTGQASIWQMNKTTLVGGGPVSPNPGPSWKAIGTGDFNHDAHSDILWQNTTSGQASIWEMNGNNLIDGGPAGPNPGPSWKAVGTGDFFGNGDSDILWQNTSSGQVSIWEMGGTNGTSLVGGGPVSPNPGPAWQAIGTGDFFGHGDSDILFQNKGTGQVSIWEMQETSLIGGGPVSAIPGPSWHAIGTGAGGSDILFQNTSGQATIWDMSETNIVGGGPIDPSPGPSWRAVGLT